jgi:molybdopterin-guanine dinucleotide biosynthesis protein MobB
MFGDIFRVRNENMKPLAIAVVGGKETGKTTTIENLIRELSKRGYKVAAIKHIPEPDFTIDTPAKDTWRFAAAGAKTVIAVSPNETATIEKGATENVPLEMLLKKLRNNDIILIEGLKKTIAKKPSIPKIAIAATKDEAKHALETYEPILAFTGPYNTQTLKTTIPHADTQKLANTIQNKLLRKQFAKALAKT